MTEMTKWPKLQEPLNFNEVEIGFSTQIVNTEKVVILHSLDFLWTHFIRRILSEHVHGNQQKSGGNMHKSEQKPQFML